MDILDLNPTTTGGRAGGSGCFHMSFRSGSRAGGASARWASSYVTRENEYADRDLDEAVYTESGNMPEWAEDNPAAFWDAADMYERANGRLYVSGDFTLPLGLEGHDQIELAKSFVEDLTGDEKLPYTMAIHGGTDDEGVERNPHVHLMFSERRNDGVERSPEDWFRRANLRTPERGGTPKSRTFHGPGWVEKARADWAAKTNRTLERLGRTERVDHRSYARQGLDRTPGKHFGPAAAPMVGRGLDHDRLEDASAAREAESTVTSLDGEISRLEAELAHLRQYGDGDREAPEQTPSVSSFGGGRASDSYPGR